MSPTGNDQATDLRELVSNKKAAPVFKIAGMRSIAVLGGKGGVGKSNVAVNAALALAEMGLCVAVLDADLGLANIDILFGVIPKFNLGHVLRGEKELADILFKVSENVFIIPGGMGLQELADIDGQRQQGIIERLDFLEDGIDMLILDTSAGIHRNTLSFATSADISVLLTTPEPTAIRDAYSVLKSLCQATGGRVDIRLVVNMAADEKEASLVADRIMSAAEQFLGYKVPYLGCVLWDQNLRDSVKNRKPLLLNRSDSIAAGGFRALAERLCDSRGSVEMKITRKDTFLRRLARQMNKKGIK
jgi:flagellar biosynthesis protein FlhG